jgi:hypothetical protein
MPMTFQEKSVWLTFAGLVAATGAYVWLACAASLPGPMAKNVLPHHGVLFALATVLLVVLLVAGHVAVARFDRRTATDERDRWIALRGTRNGSYVLATGVFLALCTAMWTEGNALMAHVLLGFWVLAQGVEIGSQLVLHRRGA